MGDYEGAAVGIEPCKPEELLSPSMCVRCMAAWLTRPPANPVPGWESWDVSRSAHRLLLDAAASAPLDYPGGHEGRGIVLAAGGVKYFACAMVVVGLLRRLGCTLPIELWHLGPAEVDPQMRSIAEQAGVRCVDALREAVRHPVRKLGGWELKPFAIIHSRFREVLYLDADSIPAHEPTYLFDDPHYQAAGAVFWPDVAPPYAYWIDRPECRSEWLPPSSWHQFGLEYRAEPAFETGQMLIDKSQCWRALQLTMHVNEHSDWYYRFLYGDKDTFHLSWRKAGLEYAMPRGEPSWAAPALQHCDFDGRLVFQHCTGGKSKLAIGRRLDTLHHADLCVEVAQDLRHRWRGQIWHWDDQTEQETEAARSLVGPYSYVRTGHEEIVLGLEWEGRIGVGAGRKTRRWTLRLLPEPTLVIVGEVGGGDKVSTIAMMLLVRRPDGVWHGALSAYERTLVELKQLECAADSHLGEAAKSA